MKRMNKKCEIIAKNMDSLVGFSDDLVLALNDITDESRGLLPGDLDNDEEEEGVDTELLQRVYERVRREAAASALGSVKKNKPASSLPFPVPCNNPEDDDDPPKNNHPGGGGVVNFTPPDTSPACGGS